MAYKSLSKLQENNYYKEFVSDFQAEARPIKISFFKKGGFYSFDYTSKLFIKGKLPYYDMRPLIIVLHKDKNHILGLNLHYLPPKNRHYVIQYFKNRNRVIWKKDKLLKNGLKWVNIKRYLNNSPELIKMYIKDNMGKGFKILPSKIDNYSKSSDAWFVGQPAQVVWKSLGFN